jgi:hypothetical protein
MSDASICDVSRSAYVSCSEACIMAILLKIFYLYVRLLTDLSFNIIIYYLIIIFVVVLKEVRSCLLVTELLGGGGVTVAPQ